jgi:hypothetical protein
MDLMRKIPFAKNIKPIFKLDQHKHISTVGVACAGGEKRG